MPISHTADEPVGLFHWLQSPKRRLGVTVSVLLAILLWAGPAQQAGAQFVRLVDLDTLVPGGTFFGPGQGGETFSGLSAPLVDRGSVAFVANTSDYPGTEVSGIFRTSVNGGPVLELVTKRTWLPEYAGPRSGPSAPNNQGEGVFAGLGFSVLDFQDGRLA